MNETLIGLVEHYSPSGQEGLAVAWLVQRMHELGFEDAGMDEVGNAVGKIGQGPRQIVLLGHIDTVIGQIPLRIEDEILFGRGAVDAKGPLACFVDAAAQTTVAAGWQIVVIGAVGEEINSRGAQFIKDRYHPDFVVIGEPNQWHRVALGYKGSALAEIRVKTNQQHSAGTGSTACEVGVALWQKILNYCAVLNADRPKLFDQLQPSLVNMAAGTDGFEQWAQIAVNTRLPLTTSPEQWYQTLRDLAPNHDIHMLESALPAWVCEKNTPLVRAFLTAIRNQNGTPAFVYKTGTADLNVVAPVWGCPALVYGPGDSSLDHTPDEKISLLEYSRSVQVVRQALNILIGD